MSHNLYFIYIRIIYKSYQRLRLIQLNFISYLCIALDFSILSDIQRYNKRLPLNAIGLFINCLYHIYPVNKEREYHVMI